MDNKITNPSILKKINNYTESNIDLIENNILNII